MEKFRNFLQKDLKKQNLRKPLAILILSAILFGGILGGLALIPHAHGDDFDHSKHSTCPVYQAGTHGLEAVVHGFLCLSISFLLLFFMVFFKKHLFFLSSEISSCRAPPALL